MNSPDLSPFHRGEQEVQTRLGVREDIEPWARKVVRPFLPEQHREFYGDLPFVVVAARDGQGRPWATILAGTPGAFHSPEPTTLVADVLPAPGDALDGALAEGDDVGILGIELATRRRNRVNGRVSSRSASGFELGVEQAFGNCPQYIHERAWRSETPAASPVRRTPASLAGPVRDWIEGADTFFIATGHREEGEDRRFGTDASHRGGQPGFVRVAGERELVFPDYAGNNHFNTLGNLLLDPRAGLLFVDFERGGLLQLTGRISIRWEPTPADLERFPGARRVLHFELDEAVELEDALPLRWSDAGQGVRSLRLVEKRRESEDVTSFLFASRDGGELPGFAPGQHLPIEVEVPGQPAPVARTYSLSNAPGEAHYRISVKREPQGLVSRALHDGVDVGAILSARAPAGEFTLDESSGRPVVLASAGVGLTPLVSMLHALVREGGERAVWFVHGARDGHHFPLADEVRALVEALPGARLHVAYSRPRPEDQKGSHYDTAGRLDAALLEELLPGLDADFYLCGPQGFMAAIQEGLERRGVVDKRIHSESFGPVG